MTAGHCLHGNSKKDPLTASPHLSMLSGFIFSPSLAHICPGRPTLLEPRWQYRSMSPFLGRAGEREKNTTPTDWQRRASVWKGELVWHCVWAQGKGDGCLSRERLSTGIASSRKLSFLFPIRTKSKLYFGPDHLQRETTGGGCTLWSQHSGSDHFLVTTTQYVLWSPASFSRF